ncbi:MAG: CarD family transcriptional regulator [Ruminococcus sp.]
MADINSEELKYSVGDYVSYRRSQVCEVCEIRRDKVCGEFRNYYILKSVYDSNSSVFVPVDSPSLVAQMERILTKDEIESLIDKSKSSELQWINAVQERSDRFEEILKSDDLSLLIAMYLLISQKREESLRSKSKIFAHDERMLQASRKKLCEAFAFSLGIKKDEVIPYIEARI